MGHLTTRDAYRNLGDRINWFTQGAPASETLYKILQVLYSEKEAKWVALLPVRPFTIKKAAKIWGTSEYKAEKLLDHLCGKALLVDSWDKGVRKFVMPPPMAGFIEFALMRTRGDIDQKYLSELYYQYMNVEEDFIKDLFYATETKLGRVFVQEPVLTNDRMNHILDYERATHMVEDAEYIGLGLCYCRHKMFHAGHPCEINAPWDVCLTFDNVARSLAQHGDYCKLISKEEALDALERSYASNLVQIGENVREHPAFICNCCGCCCEALLAIKRFAIARTIHSNFIARAGNDCRGCGKCEKVCPVNAIHMEDGPAGKRFAFVDPERCIGCGVCVRSCAFGQLTLEARPERAITPLNTVNRVVAMAAERGMIKELLEDNDAMGNHRIMAAVIGAIMKLPGAPRALAVAQLKSRYLENLIGKMG